MINLHEFFFLINNDETLKYELYKPLSVNATEMNFDYTFDSFEKLSLGGGEYYFPVSGEKLHFYFSVEDDTGNVEERYFVVELQ